MHETRYKGKKLILYAILIIFFTLICVYVVKFLLIFPWEPDDLFLYEKPVSADLIVVLEGDISPRLRYACKLADLGYCDTIFIPGYKERNTAEYLDSVKDRYNIILGSPVTSTYEEAVKTEDFIKKKPVNNIILVTSNYHSFRASWIFNKVLSSTGVNVISCPVPPEYSWFDPDNVKEGTRDYELFKKEQTKFFGVYFLIGWTW